MQTFVTEYNSALITEAVRRELSRGGQVYYLHNRIEDIERVAASLKMRLGDQVRIQVAHGAMSEEALSDVWRQLVDGEIDVLVCTTIIETGVDVPNVNTLIIENGDCGVGGCRNYISFAAGSDVHREGPMLTFYLSGGQGVK